MFKLSRRGFVASSAALAGGMVVFGSGVRAQQAAAGRLPENPLVITPTDRPGVQGGDWNHALVGGGALSTVVRCQGYEPQVRFDPTWTGLIPNVSESYEVNDDATEYVFHLRKGHKWSDGAPYTTEDIRFWYEDLFQDPDLRMTNQQDHWFSGGEVGELIIVDEQTFKVTFSTPNGFFVHRMAWGHNDATTRAPAHYLRQFHKKYNPDADKLAQERGFAGWVALMQRESGLGDVNVFYQNSTRPTLEAWAFTSAPGEDTERAVAERNPYYFKVDTEGTQLPYFDRVVYQMVSDPQVLLLKTMQGEIDMIDQTITTPLNKPVLFDAQERGNFRFYTLIESAANVMVFMLNLNHTDPVKNTLFNTREFRQALSVAIDRRALIDAVLVGQGAPAQPSIIEGDPLYNERLAKQHTEYDPDEANRILDTLLPDRGRDGYRLDAEGRRLSIIFEIDQARTVFLDLFDLVIPMFQKVGIDAQVRSMDRSLWETRVRTGRDFDGTAHQFGANSGIGAMLDPRYFVPFNTNAIYANGWALYFTDPDSPNAVEPPEEVKAQQQLYKTLLLTGDVNRQNEIMAEILENAADQFLVFGVSLPPDGYGVVKNNMVNTMDVMPNAFIWPTPAPTRPEQFFKA